MKATFTLNGKSIEVEVTEEEAKKLMGEKKNSGGRLANGESYSYIDSAGYIQKDEELGHPFDDKCYEMGNYFHTEEEAEAHLARQKAIVKINRRIVELNDGWEPNWKTDMDKFQIHFEHCDNKFSVGIYWTLEVPKTIYFMKSEDIVQQIIQEFPEELKLIFNVK